MIAIFSDSQNLVYSNIRDVDFSMYDELLLTSMSAPEFVITMDYDVFSSQSDEFSVWWKTFKLGVFSSNISVTLKDRDNNLLARGKLYSYHEDRENFAVEFTCRSEMGVWLEEEVSMTNFGPNGAFMAFYPYYSLAELRQLWKTWFSKLWVRHCGSTIGYQFYDEIESLNGLANVIKKTHFASDGQYMLQVRSTYSGSRAGLIKLFAQFFNAKFIYDIEEKKFHIIPFQQYLDDPIEITGYVSSEEYDSQDQVIESSSIVQSVMYRTVLPGNPWISITDKVNAYVFSRLQKSVNFKRYSIWGYAAQVVYSGYTIRLDGVDYYVQDVEYDTETLDSIKSFRAKGIRFFS